MLHWKTALAEFARAIVIGDIVAVNGQPVKGTFVNSGYNRLLATLLSVGPICLASFVVTASPAAAQTSGKWEIELHGGGLLPTNPTGGTVSLPGPGPVFTGPTIAGAAGPSSRRESSWYFGDGTTLFNQVASSLGLFPFNQVIGRITALDPVLGRSLGELRRGGNIGARVSRELTPRFSAELAVDYSFAPLQITSTNTNAIEATRASFTTAFNGLFTTAPGASLSPSVTSTAALDNGSGHQIFTTGVLNMNLRTTGNLVPYATVGAGLISTTGKTPNATLTGNYRLSFPPAAGSAPFNETDNVTVRDARDDQTAAAILGGGVKYHVSPRYGIRLDIRVSLSKNTATTQVGASPNVALGSPTGILSPPGNPTIILSTIPSVITSSLSGSPISGLRTFSGSGVFAHTNITAGVFWRF